MKRIHITESKLLGRDGDVAERARWLTWTHIPGSVWLAFYNREKPIQSFDIPLLQLRNERCRGEAVPLAYWLFHAITFERSKLTFTKIAIKKIKPVWH